MLTNLDGSMYCSDSVEEILIDRFDQEDYPYVSDICGSDWGLSSGWEGGTVEEYRRAVRMHCRRLYDDSNGVWSKV